MKINHPAYRAELAACLDRLCGLSALDGKTVMITGATGMIGACLTDMICASGADVRVLALCRNEARGLQRFSSYKNVEVIACDLTKPLSGLPRADYVVHAASNAHPMAFSADPVGTMQANILGTMHLLNNLRGGRLLFVSTGEIYGENPDVQDGFSEDSYGKIDPMNPRSCYPESKRAAETLCASYVRQFGADAVAARLCYVYGPTITPDNSRADAQFLRKALAGEDIVMKSTGSQLRSYCYVTDAACAILTLLLRGETGLAYNVANRDSNHTIREYAETLAKLAGVNVVFELPPDAEKAGYSAVSRAVQNPARLEGLGWKAAHSLESGMRQMLNILRDEA